MAMMMRSTLFVCDQCSLEYKGKCHLVEHINNIHRGRTFVCDACSKEFNRKIDLARHIGARHKHRARSFKCQLCSCDFHSKRGLRLHHSVIHLGTKFQCDTCGKLCGQKGQLVTHIKSVHQHRRPFECNACGAKFTVRSGLDAHSSFHTGKQLKCDDCGASFATKSDISSHIRSVHLKLRLFDCVECGVKFAHNSNLNRHTRHVHKKIVFTCDVCSKSYTTKNHLAIHYFSAHMQLNAFKCSVCDQQFSKASALKYHRKIHG